MNNPTVVAWSGSDSSYDLIVEVVRPRPEAGVQIDVLGMDETELLQRFIAEATAHGQALTTGLPLGFRCVVAQRVPEPFVWRARMRAALDKALDTSLQYASTNPDPDPDPDPDPEPPP